MEKPLSAAHEVVLKRIRDIPSLPEVVNKMIQLLGEPNVPASRIAELISYVSHRMPLEPGDVIATGTPAGVAAMHQPPAWLHPGATVTVEVEGFGRLSNPVQRGEAFLDS